MTAPPPSETLSGEESAEQLLRYRIKKLVAGKEIGKGTSLDLHFAVGQNFSFTSPKKLENFKKLLRETKPELIEEILELQDRLGKLEKSGMETNIREGENTPPPIRPAMVIATLHHHLGEELFVKCRLVIGRWENRLNGLAESFQD